MFVKIPCTVLHTLADVNLHASRAARHAEDPTEDATSELSSELDITTSHASSLEYCNTSGLEKGSSIRVEKGAGSEAIEGEVEEECRNDHGSVFTDADGSTDDCHVHLYCCIFHLHF